MLHHCTFTASPTTPGLQVVPTAQQRLGAKAFEQFFHLHLMNIAAELAIEPCRNEEEKGSDRGCS